MKWSFLAGLLTSAAVLAPIAVSAKAAEFHKSHKAPSSAGLISGRLLAKKSSVLGINITKESSKESQQTALSDRQKAILTMEKLGRGEGSVKAKSPDILLSRGLGSGGGEGGGSPSQRAPSVKTKDMTLPGRPMLANQQVTSTPVDGERGPSLGSGSGSASSTFSMPTPVSITVGQGHQGETSGGIPGGGSSRSGSPRSQTQDTSSSSSSSSSPSLASESSASESGSSSIGSSGGGGGGSSASEEGIMLKPEAVQEYQQLKLKRAQAEKTQDTTISVTPVEPVPGHKWEGFSESTSPQLLEKAKTGLKKVGQKQLATPPELSVPPAPDVDAPPAPPAPPELEAPSTPPISSSSGQKSTPNRGGLLAGIAGFKGFNKKPTNASASSKPEGPTLLSQLKKAHGKTAGSRVALTPGEVALEKLKKRDVGVDEELATLMRAAPKKGDNGYQEAQLKRRELIEERSKIQDEIKKQRKAIEEEAQKLAPKKGGTPLRASAPQKSLKERMTEENKGFQASITKLEEDLKQLRDEASKHTHEKGYKAPARLTQIPGEIETLRGKIKKNEGNIWESERWEKEKADRLAKSLGQAPSVIKGQKALQLSKEQQLVQLHANLGKAAVLLDLFTDKKLSLAMATVMVKEGSRDTSEERESLVKLLAALNEKQIQWVMGDLKLIDPHARLNRLKDGKYMEALSKFGGIQKKPSQNNPKATPQASKDPIQQILAPVVKDVLGETQKVLDLAKELKALQNSRAPIDKETGKLIPVSDEKAREIDIQVQQKRRDLAAAKEAEKIKVNAQRQQEQVTFEQAVRKREADAFALKEKINRNKQLAEKGNAEKQEIEKRKADVQKLIDAEKGVAAKVPFKKQLTEIIAEEEGVEKVNARLKKELTQDQVEFTFMELELQQDKRLHAKAQQLKEAQEREENAKAAKRAEIQRKFSPQKPVADAQKGPSLLDSIRRGSPLKPTKEEESPPTKKEGDLVTMLNQVKRPLSGKKNSSDDSGGNDEEWD